MHSLSWEYSSEEEIESRSYVFITEMFFDLPRDYSYLHSLNYNKNKFQIIFRLIFYIEFQEYNLDLILSVKSKEEQKKNVCMYM